MAIDKVFPATAADQRAGEAAALRQLELLGPQVILVMIKQKIHKMVDRANPLEQSLSRLS